MYFLMKGDSFLGVDLVVGRDVLLDGLQGGASPLLQVLDGADHHVGGLGVRGLGAGHLGLGQLEDLSGEVLHDDSQVHGGTGTDTLGVVSLAEQTVDTSDGELESGTG
jgi:hypothetical protein